MAIEKVLEFARDGLRSLTGLAPDLGFPREIKPAREWFNYLFNLIFSTLNELIAEVNALREELDALKRRVDAASSSGGTVVIPPKDPSPPVVVPDPVLTFSANISHLGVVGESSSSGTAQGILSGSTYDGSTGKVTQIINYRLPNGGSSYQQRTGEATIVGGKWQYSFPLNLVGAALNNATTQSNIFQISYVFSITGRRGWDKSVIKYTK